jgi:hypothetical protein
MFIGHYALGFVLKKKFNTIPLWILFIAVQFVDILAFILVLFGIEKMSYNPSINPFLRTSIDYVPFTHSLFSNLLIALIIFLMFLKLKNKLWGLVLAGAVLSHWFIDFASHNPDLPIIFNNFKVGLGLWNFPWLAFIIEVGLFCSAGYYLIKNSNNFKRTTILIVLAVILYTPAMFAPEKEAPVAIVSIMSLSMYTLFAALAWWTERGKKSTI